jgi:hypothetical protein
MTHRRRAQQAGSVVLLLVCLLDLAFAGLAVLVGSAVVLIGLWRLDWQPLAVAPLIALWAAQSAYLALQHLELAGWYLEALNPPTTDTP